MREKIEKYSMKIKESIYNKCIITSTNKNTYISQIRAASNNNNFFSTFDPAYLSV